MNKEIDQDDLINDLISNMCNTLRPVMEKENIKKGDRLLICFISISEMISRFVDFLNEIGLKMSYARVLEKFNEIQITLKEQKKNDKENEKKKITVGLAGKHSLELQLKKKEYLE